MFLCNVAAAESVMKSTRSNTNLLIVVQFSPMFWLLMLTEQQEEAAQKALTEGSSGC